MRSRPSKVGTQRFGHDDGAVGLLVIFDDREPRAAHGQAAAIQRVQKLRLACLPRRKRRLARRA